MKPESRVRVGLIGTSWWAQGMYLPALADHAAGAITALCGRDPSRTASVAERWQVPSVFTDYEALIRSGTIDALIVSTPNHLHHPITLKAIEAGLHVLCEKPLAMDYSQAAEMAAAADSAGVVHMVPFTYRFMPTSRFLKELLDDGYLGKPYHLNLRYYSGYGRTSEYRWRFDLTKAGAGAVADIGSHFLDLAAWFFGPIKAVCARFGYLGDREREDPEGNAYEPADDTAMLLLEFANEARGAVHVSMVAYEGSESGQAHHLEFHGSKGTLYSHSDWDRVQRVQGAQEGDPGLAELPIPEHIWGNARRDAVQHTYDDVFHRSDFMARDFVTAIAEGRPVSPDFHDGAAVQRLIDAAIVSDREGTWVEVERIGSAAA